MNPELAFGALYANYVFVGTVIRTAIALAEWLLPGTVFVFIAWCCLRAVDRWRDWRQRRAAVMRRLDELAAERNPDQDLEDIRAMWAINSTDTREDKTK